MDTIDNNSEGENTLFDINPTDKENDLLQPIKDENNNMDIANDNQSSDEVQSSDTSAPLTKKRSRTQLDEVQSVDTSMPLTKKPKLGGNRTRKIKSKNLHLKKSKRMIRPKKQTSSTIKQNKLKHKHKRNTRRKR